MLSVAGPRGTHQPHRPGPTHPGGECARRSLSPPACRASARLPLAPPTARLTAARHHERCHGAVPRRQVPARHRRGRPVRQLPPFGHLSADRPPSEPLVLARCRPCQRSGVARPPPGAAYPIPSRPAAQLCMRSQPAYPHRPALTSHSADDTSISQPGQGGRFECRPGVTLPADSQALPRYAARSAPTPRRSRRPRSGRGRPRAASAPHASSTTSACGPLPALPRLCHPSWWRFQRDRHLSTAGPRSRLASLFRPARISGRIPARISGTRNQLLGGSGFPVRLDV